LAEGLGVTGIITRKTIRRSPRHAFMLTVWPIAIALEGMALIFMLRPVTIGAVLPLRLIAGTMAVLVLPGALAAAALGQRSRHFLESLAVSAFGSFAIVAALGLVGMALRLSITTLVAALMALNAALTIVCLRRRQTPRMLAPRFAGADIALAIVLAALGIVAYRWGDDVKAVGWELSLHLSYVREYASGAPLGFDTAVLRPPQVIAQNYLYFWEFLLAMLARASGVDPLVAALKSRWLLPVFGFATFFFMVQRLTASSSAALRTTWVMVAAVLVQFLTLPPNAYETFIESGPLRQVGAFLGSIHHSDSAMEILLPMLIGSLFWALRKGTAKNWAAFAAALVVAFLWHPREYFQVMWYGAVAILVDAIAGVREGRGAWRRRAVNYATMIACYVAVAVVLYLGMPESIRSSSEHVAGLGAHGAALREFVGSISDWRGWIAGSLPFAFHLHGYELAGLAPGPPIVFSWLVLAVPLAGVLAWSTRRRVRWIGLYLLVLWLVSLCSYRFQQLMQAVTYHEILISKPRLVHLFAYVVIGLGWSEFVRLSAGRSSSASAWMRACASAGLTGVLFAWAWRTGAPAFATLFTALNVTFFVAAVGLAVTLRLRSASMSSSRSGLQPGAALAAVTFVVFALPVCFAPAADRWSAMLRHRLDPADLFSGANPIELAPDTIRYLQTEQPPRTRFLVEPGRPHMVALYSPLYVMPLLGNVHVDVAQLQETAAGKHPVFNAAMRHGAPALDAVRSFLNVHAIQYVLGTKDYVEPFLALSAEHPGEFTPTFLSADRANVILQYRRRAGSP
jgi:hypothetical protein